MRSQDSIRKRLAGLTLLTTDSCIVRPEEGRVTYFGSKKRCVRSRMHRRCAVKIRFPVPIPKMLEDVKQVIDALD